MATEADDRWYVQFDSQEVRLMTLDEIQEAFEGGLIHENTYLIEVGSSNWQTLADVAGLNDSSDEEEQEAPAAAPAPAMAAPAPAPAPVVAAPQAAAPMAARPAPAPAAARPAPVAQSFPPASVAPQSAWPPVASVAPASMASSAPFSSGMNSTLPVVQDLDLDMSGASFKSGKRTALMVGLAAVVVLGGGGFALAKMDSAPTPAPVAAAPAPVQTTSPFKMDPVPSTPAATPSTPSSPSSDTKSDSAGSNSKLSDDMKAALLAADKSKPSKTKGSTRTASASHHAASSGGSSKKGSGGGVFKAGGSEHDPLNSKL